MPKTLRHAVWRKGVRMIRIWEEGGRYVRLEDGCHDVRPSGEWHADVSGSEVPCAFRPLTMAERILLAHDATTDASGGASGSQPQVSPADVPMKEGVPLLPESLRIRFDALASHDITYVGILQTARAGGLEAFPVPWVLTNCHNSLCATGGTINADDHAFGLSAARRYGGIFVPPHAAVIHQYMRERHAACGAMILGSDSHTRYGALGTLGIGEGGPEIARQLLGLRYALPAPAVTAVRLSRRPVRGVGPHDVALALIGAVYGHPAVRNGILEFVGPGIRHLSMDFRSGMDVMTTETACLSSIWETDDTVRAWYAAHGRPEAYRPLHPDVGAMYQAVIDVDLSRIRPMIALPFHPSHTHALSDFIDNAADILHAVDREARRHAAAEGETTSGPFARCLHDGGVQVDQAIVAGCAGGSHENLRAVRAVLDAVASGRRNGTVGDHGRQSGGMSACALSVYPASLPVQQALVRDGTFAGLVSAGAIVKTAFCGPCFGAGDIPANGTLGIRHTTRNFPNREGSKPAAGQMAGVALMDARSIAATVAHGGRLTPADTVDWEETHPAYAYDPAPYRQLVYQGFGRPRPEVPLVYGPGITDWPEMDPMPRVLELEIASVLTDPVTTTDELIPSGETSSYRSDPLKLAAFTLSRKDPGYVGRARAIATAGCQSAIAAVRPGDGSAREQAASCQRVLGGRANLADGYATRRYRGNLVNWGILPLVCEDAAHRLRVGDRLRIEGVSAALEEWARRGEPGRSESGCRSGEDDKSDALVLHATVTRADGSEPVDVMTALPGLTAEEARLLLDGGLIGHWKRARRDILHDLTADGSQREGRGN